MKMKKKTGAAKKAAPRKKPAAKSSAPKKAAKREPTVSSVVAEAKARPTAYTPTPVQGIGWAPFRYPPQ